MPIIVSKNVSLVTGTTQTQTQTQTPGDKQYHYQNNTSQQQDLGTINEIRMFWPVPIEELFDIEHWNSFHRVKSRNRNRSRSSLPLLVNSVGGNDNDNDNDNGLCWTPGNDKSVVSDTAIRNNPSYNRTFHDTLLPLLTKRMLFDTASNTVTSNTISTSGHQHNQHLRTSFFLKGFETKVVEFLVGSSLKNFHKLAKHKLKKTAPTIADACKRPKNNSKKTKNTTSKKKKKNPDEDEPTKTVVDSPQRRADTLLQKTVYQALIPAQPWRRLASKCKDVHMGKATTTKSTTGDGDSGGGGYITLHARIEPELMTQNCGKQMEHNLTLILNMVDDFAKNYNRNLTESNFYHNTTKTGKRKGKRRRPLEGILIAVSRKELAIDRGSRFHEISNYNWKKINERSISYDTDGNELFTSRIKESSNNPLGTDYGFYKNEKYQTELFSHPKAGALYDRYVAEDTDTDGNPFLPLPSNYYGDLLPAVTNFWLALKSDVFIGVRGSTWSEDVWTTRYYLGKGDGNYRYTATRGLLKIPNGGLPPVHNC
eukprot:jgi/Psemu1/327858/estExt_fgenesh1_pg.C_8580001